jgi:riboflavin-specific deaminase-like protein
MTRRKASSEGAPITTRARPFVFVNMAMTADGKIATANREISSFGSAADKENLLRLRSRADAVMAGARTVDLNPVTMGPGSERYRKLRVKAGLAEWNLRIIVSGSGTIDPHAEIFRHRFSPILVLTTEKAGARRLKSLRGIADAVHVCGAHQIDFRNAFEWLRREWNVNSLLCEGGGQLNSALFSAGLVDELHLTICPLIFGGRAAPAISDGAGAKTLEAATGLTLRTHRPVGPEMFLVYEVTSAAGPQSEPARTIKRAAPPDAEQLAIRPIGRTTRAGPKGG